MHTMVDCRTSDDYYCDSMKTTIVVCRLFALLVCLLFSAMSMPSHVVLLITKFSKALLWQCRPGCLKNVNITNVERENVNPSNFHISIIIVLGNAIFNYSYLKTNHWECATSEMNIWKTSTITIITALTRKLTILTPSCEQPQSWSSSS